ncbi:MAG TPA: CHAD domain-containing protein [Pyrinomonadaceae bacterium]
MAKAREIEGLDCGADAASGIRLVLSSRIDETLAYRDAALVAEDPEGVHDMRVASRRLRSALRDFAPHMNDKRVAGVRVELKKLADALGRVRDIDVEAAALEEAAREAPETVRAGVEELARARLAGSAEAREELARELGEDGLARLREEFADALANALDAARERRKGKGGGGAGRRGGSFGEVGRQVIVARWEELRERAGSLYRPFKTKRLHKTRISAKRLRYALELFTPCMGDELKDFAREVAHLQKSLGEVHDCDEWIASLGVGLAKRERDAADDAKSPDAGARAGRAETSAWLFDHFVERRNLHYREAFARWRAWGREDFESRLRACVSGRGSEGVRAAAEGEAAEGVDGEEPGKRRPRRSAKASRGGRESSKVAN